MPPSAIITTTRPGWMSRLITASVRLGGFGPRPVYLPFANVFGIWAGWREHRTLHGRACARRGHARTFDAGCGVLTAQLDDATRLDDPSLLDRATELGRVLFSQDDDLLAEAARRQRSKRFLAGSFTPTKPALPLVGQSRICKSSPRSAARRTLRIESNICPCDRTVRQPGSGVQSANFDSGKSPPHSERPAGAGIRPPVVQSFFYRLRGAKPAGLSHAKTNDGDGLAGGGRPVFSGAGRGGGSDWRGTPRPRKTRFATTPRRSPTRCRPWSGGFLTR